MAQQVISIGGQVVAFCAALLLPGPEEAHGQTFLENTEFNEVRTGSRLTDMVGSARRMSFELADGTPVDLSRWYDSSWTDVGVTFVTKIDPTLGIYWGFSTGERGEKYVIQPSLTLGFIKLFELSEQEIISLSVKAAIEGRLRERTCIADYGAIGGAQVVNCRLAASPLPPAETLGYLFNEPPPDQIKASLRYIWTF